MEPNQGRTPLLLLAVFLLVAGGVGAAGFVYLGHQREDLRRQIDAELAAVAELKARQFGAWRAERIANTSVISSNPLVAAGIERLLGGAADPGLRKELLAWFDTLQKQYAYEDVLLVDPRGEIVLSLAGASGPLEPKRLTLVKLALASGSAVVSDPQILSSGKATLDDFAPLLARHGGGSRPVGVLVLATDPSLFLDAMSVSWPTASETAETLVVRREADEVAFLSDGRRLSASPPRRISIHASTVTAELLARGAEATLEGLDDQGASVLASWRPIPESSWSVIAKVSTAEILEPVRERTRGIILVTMGILAFAASSVAFLWRGQTAAFNRRLLQHEGYRARLLANMHEAVLGLDNDLVLRAWNRAAADIYGWDEKEVIGKPLEEVLPADQEDICLPELLRRLYAEGRVEIELRRRRKDGATVQIESTMVATRGADGRISGYVSVDRDVTQRRRMEARLLVGERMASLGTLAAGVAHEINNPLSYVVSNISFATEELSRAAGPGALPDPTCLSDVLEALHEAGEGAARVQRIVRELKALSRPEEDVGSGIDVNAVLEKALKLAHNEIRCRARLVLDLKPVEPVRGSEHRLGQVFLNLLVNAAQAIPEGRAEENEIRVASWMERGRVAVVVEDTGSGMSPEVMKRIFDPFFTTKPVGTGTGIGLAICHGIVEALGGEIQVESEPGAGTSFRVLLPVGEAASVAAAPRPEPPAATRGRVLVVDDEPLVGRAVCRVLAAEHDVESVTSASAALSRIESGERFDLLLCDLMMPEMSGMELHAAVERLAPDVACRFVFLTGGAFTQGARDFLDEKRCQSVEKPFDPSALRDLVTERIRAAAGPS